MTFIEFIAGLPTWLGVFAVAALVATAIRGVLAGGRPLVRASAATDGGETYSVTLDKVLPEALAIEWVWLCITLPAKLLYALGHDQDRANERRQILATLVSLGAHHVGADFSELSVIQVVTGESPGDSGALVATICFKDATSRSIHTKLPRKALPGQLHDSWVAVMLAACEHLDDSQRSLLSRACGHMAELYQKRGSGRTVLSGSRSATGVPDGVASVTQTAGRRYTTTPERPLVGPTRSLPESSLLPTPH